MFEIKIPGIPPSVNHYVKHTRNGRSYVTTEAQSFKDAIGFHARACYVVGKTFNLSLRVVLGAGDKGDVDNFPKLVMDGLAAAGVFRNKKGKIVSDAHVEKLVVEVDRFERPECGRTEIQVEANRL